MVTATPEERKKQGPGGSKMVAKEIDVSCPEKSSTRKSKSCLDTDSDNTKSMDWTNVIDPQLWSGDSMLDAMNLDDNELNSFEDQVFSTVLDGPATAAAETTTSSNIVSNGLGESDEELDISSVLAESEALFNNDIVKSTEHDGQQYRSPQGFIAMYAAINIVCRETFAKIWANFAANKVSFEDGIGQFATRGAFSRRTKPDGISLQKDRRVFIYHRD